MKQNKPLFSVYYMAGFPALEDTVRLGKYLEQAGVDFLEIGFPFSDPIADGSTIQQAAQKALQNGMNLHILFEQLGTWMDRQVPLFLMGYLNPVLQFGIDAFLEKCAALKIRGLILPDMPIEFYLRHFEKKMQALDIQSVFLITPATKTERILYLDNLTTGFLYVVSSFAITGQQVTLQAHQAFYERLQALALKNRLIMGFGIQDRNTYEYACQYASGAIVGTRFLQFIQNQKAITDENIQSFVNSFKAISVC